MFPMYFLVSNLLFMFPIYVCIFLCTNLRFSISKNQLVSKVSKVQKIVLDKVWLFSRSWWWIFVIEQSCYSTILQNLNRLGATKNRKSNKSRDSAEKNLHFETVFEKIFFRAKIVKSPLSIIQFDRVIPVMIQKHAPKLKVFSSPKIFLKVGCRLP